MTMAAPLTPEQKELCILAAELEADISEAWISFYNSTSGQNEIFDAADRGPDRAPILLIMPEASHGDRKLAVRVPQLVRALLALCRFRKARIGHLEAELRRMNGEPEPDPNPQDHNEERQKQKSKAQWCAITCGARSFKEWLSQVHQVDTSDRIRTEARVRTMLRIQSRTELDTDNQAGERWVAMWKDFKTWEKAR